MEEHWHGEDRDHDGRASQIVMFSSSGTPSGCELFFHVLNLKTRVCIHGGVGWRKNGQNVRKQPSSNAIFVGICLSEIEFVRNSSSPRGIMALGVQVFSNVPAVGSEDSESVARLGRKIRVRSRAA